jgi:transposase InsO family protein
LLKRAKLIRKKHPRLGGRKLFLKLTKFLQDHDIKMGRDGFFDFMKHHDLLLKQRKRYHVTTNSKHWMKKYPNLIKNLEPLGPNHIWVSDITYWKIKSKHLYISFITDVYSKKIVGYHVADNLEAEGSIIALRMALKDLSKEVTGLIHHSDRGTQYCSGEYVKTLKRRNIEISMTENGDPLENAVAERVNGIIKGEYLFNYPIQTLEEARKVLKSVVKLYNEDRPHSSIGNATPVEVHENKTNIEIKRLWKNYYRKKELCSTIV